MYDLIIVGAGIFGLTVAQRAAELKGARSLVIERRGHIGGNAFSEADPQTGIEVHKYGAHLFHTSSREVWDYASRFTQFTNYQHKVYTTHRGEVFPMPINLGTINQFFRAAYSPQEARDLVRAQAAKAPQNPQNLFEQGVSLIGEPLFDAFIKNYTEKQWQVPALDLGPEIIKRLPVRYNYDNRYFNNTFEGLPALGYAAMFEKMVEAANCGPGSAEIRLNTDFFSVREELLAQNPGAKIVFTGPIDAYFSYQFGELTWRSLDLEREVLKTADFQGCPVMNYADLDAPWTRIHEFKHFHPERAQNPDFPGYRADAQETVIVREYSKTWQRGDEPYYPVNTASDLEKLAKYQELAALEPNVLFGGRLGEYKYYDMDKVFENALRVASDVL